MFSSFACVLRIYQRVFIICLHCGDFAGRLGCRNLQHAFIICLRCEILLHVFFVCLRCEVLQHVICLRYGCLQGVFSVGLHCAVKPMKIFT